MKFSLFGIDINIGKKSVKKENSDDKIVKDFINSMAMRGFSFVGNSITDCGVVSINLNTMYEIHESNKMAFAYSNKISQMVSGGEIAVVNNDNEKIENSQSKKEIDELLKFLGGKENLRLFVGDFYDQVFSSGQVFCVPSVVNGLGMNGIGGVAKILDTRGINILTNQYGVVQKYIYQTTKGVEEYTPGNITDLIVYRDLNQKNRGKSIYTSIVYDAITNVEASRTQMYFFKNNAKPNLYIMLNPEMFAGKGGAKKKEEFDRQWQEKYGGSVNVGKEHSSYMIKDIKTLDISNVDLDLINLRDSNNESFSVVFMLDARLIGIHKKTGSYGEIESITIRQGNEQIEAYARVFSNFLNDIYKKFINPSMEGYFSVIPSKFKDEIADKNIGLKEKKEGVITGNEYRKRFGMQEEDDEALNVYSSNNKSVNFYEK